MSADSSDNESKSSIDDLLKRVCNDKEIFDTFYLFETHVPKTYKFGMTSRNIEVRLRGYSGVSKPKKLIGYFQVGRGKGRLFEELFKQLLRFKCIKIAEKFGWEYFTFIGKATELFNNFVICLITAVLKKQNK